MDSTFPDEIKKYPFIRICIPLIVGIIFSSLFNIPDWFAVSLFFTSIPVFFILYRLQKYNTQFIAGILVNVLLLSFGLLITNLTLNNNHKISISDTKGLLIGEISRDPKITENNININVNIRAIRNNDDWIASSGRTLLYLERDSLSERLMAGDLIVFSPELSGIENRGNPEEFDYKKYLGFNLINTSDYLSGGEWLLLESEQNIRIRYHILRFRTGLINTLRELGLNEDELSVVSALALGYKDNLSNEIKHNYSSSGAMHILAVSGLHVGIIYGMLVFFLSFIKSDKYKVLKVSLIIIFIWFYAFLTGLSPSVSRASLMFTITALGSLQKHKSGTLNAVALSAFILLVINPLNIMDIGFQLSYIAVIGIVVIQPHITGLIDVKNRFLKWLWSLTTVSLAAQIATAPLCIYYFHQFSNYFLLTNYILIPLSTIAIWLCIAVFALSATGAIGLFFTKILGYVVRFMNISTDFIDGLPFSLSDGLYINVVQMFILYFLIIVLFLFIFISRKYKHLVLFVSGVIVFSVIGLYQDIRAERQKYIIVYNINKVTAINIIDGKDNILFADLDNTDRERIEFSAGNNWLKKGLEEEKYINLSSGNKTLLSDILTLDNKRVFYKNKFIGFEGIRMFVLDNNFIYDVNGTEEKTDIDFIVLSNNPSVTLSEVNDMFTFKKIIIDSSNRDYKAEEWISENISGKYPIHYVRKDGAFVYGF